MKSTGVVRKVDELGRIVIPKELRRTLNINERDPMEIFVDGEKIIINKYESRMSCAITGDVSDENMTFFNGKIVLSPEGAELLIDELRKHSVTAS